MAQNGHSQVQTDFKTFLAELNERLWKRELSLRSSRKGWRMPRGQITREELALIRTAIARNALPCVIRWRSEGPELTVYHIADGSPAEPILRLLPKHLSAPLRRMRDASSVADGLFKAIVFTEQNRLNLERANLVQPSRRSSLPPPRS